MTKFCEVCKQIVKCDYCIRYGTKGVYLYLDNLKKHEKMKFPNFDINKIQLQSLGNSRKNRS